MSGERKQSLFIVAYQGRATADVVHAKLRELQKDNKIDIKTAAVVYRKENGKLKLVHKRRVTVWKGAFGGAAIGLVLAGTGVGALAAAGIGALIGSSRSGQRRDAKEFLEDKLGPDESALVVLVSDADWVAVQSELAPYGGEDLKVELTSEAEEQIAALANDAEVVEAVEDEVEVEVEDVI